MKKFRIPQEVQIEDRIFGPITMRRLIILTIGGGITYLFYIGTQNSGVGVWFPLVFIFGSLTLALAFLEPFGMKFHKFLARVIEFFVLPRLRLWDKRYTQNIFFSYIRYSSRQWEKLKSQQVPEGDIYREKQRQQEEVSDLLDVLSLDLANFSDESIQKYRVEHKKHSQKIKNKK